MKKLLAMVLALVMTLSLAVSASAFKDDKDISADYAEAAAVLDGMGVFEGVDGSFLPKDNITRAQVATIIYRVATADTAGYGKDKSGLYATYNKFSDMTGAGWASGYIGYAANAEYVKGYPDGTFKPSGNVTGYEVLAMILRVVGYDKNNEFSGADWALNVAKYAEQLGILKNVDKSTDLSAPASRELVAELLFQAIQVPMVTYTPAFGYQTDKVQKLDQTSIGYKNFNLDSKDAEDEWGRPGTEWFDSKSKDTYATVIDTAAASFNVATSQCDICEALGVKKTTTIVDTYTNGVKDTKDVTYTATATKAMVGAQGQQIEFYEVDGGYRLVVIDTYLAKVTDVVTEKTDSKGHVTRDDYTKFEAYVGDKTSDGLEYVYVAGNDYAEDDYVLVNINDNADNDVKFVGLTGAQAYIEVVGKADSFEGVQSKNWYNTAKHTIDDKDYDDAVQFNLDAAGTTGTVKYTWFLDQFGNLIGSAAIDNSNYAVLKDLIWVVGRPGHAEATLVYMDGKEDTVEVSYIDGANASGWIEASDDAVPELEDTASSVGFSAKTALVASDSKYNGVYEGVALYRVDTLKDGTASLESTGITFVDEATVDTNTSSIYDGNTKKGTINDNTQFVVRETNDDDEYVYVTYDRKTLPQYAEDSVDLFYTVNEKTGFVNRVYIKNAVDEADFGDHLFVTTDAFNKVSGTLETYEMNVLVDGVERTVRTNKDNLDVLAANVGRLFHVEWEDADSSVGYYGFIDEVRLINEDEDIDDYDAGDCDYLSGDLAIEGNTIKTDDIDWTITGDTKFIGVKDLNDIDLDDDAIWVIAADTRTATAATVYVGVDAKLGTGVSLTVDAANAKDADGKAVASFGTVAYDKDTKTFTVTFNKGVASADLKLSGEDVMTVVASGSDATTGTLTLDVNSTEDTENKSVAVYNEEATDDETYTVVLNWYESDDDTTLKTVSISKAGTNPTAVDVSSMTSASTLTDAVASPKAIGAKDGEFTVNVTATSAKAKVEIVSAENQAAAETVLPDEAPASATSSASVTVDGNTALNGGIVVIRVTAENGDVAYYVLTATNA